MFKEWLKVFVQMLCAEALHSSAYSRRSGNSSYASYKGQGLCKIADLFFLAGGGKGLIKGVEGLKGPLGPASQGSRRPCKALNDALENLMQTLMVL